MNTRRALAVLAISVALLGAGAWAASASASGAPATVVCATWPCTNSQALEVFDHNGAPIFSVGAVGGPGVFGDYLTERAPSTSVFATPDMILSPQDPSDYAASHNTTTNCNTAGAAWIAPQGVWKCTDGTWVQVSIIP